MDEKEQIETVLSTSEQIVEQSSDYKLAILAEKDISEKVTKAIKSNKAHRRWFWELLQNAKDTIVNEANRQVSIKLTYSKTEDGEPTIKFEHSGNPFMFATDPTRFDDLTNLILPLSGKPEGNTTGKFGTGFLSTHILSLKVRVEGVYRNEQGRYYDFNIVIDRTETDRQKRIMSIVKSLSEQQSSFRLISDKSYTSDKNNYRTTKFTYFLAHNINGADFAYKIVEEGIEDLLQTLPYVLKFVPEIYEVNIIDKEITKTQMIFRKTSESTVGELKVNTISKSILDLDGTNISHDEVFIASLSDDQVEAAIEVLNEHGSYRLSDFKSKYKGQTKKDFPILFSSFPLIGSEDFKFPLVINSKSFNPNETRDGVELKTNIDGNQSLIDKAVVLYQRFLDIASADWKDIYILAITENTIPTNHDWISKPWYEKGTASFQGVLNPIRNKILMTPIVDVLTVDSKIERKPIKTTEFTNQVFFPLKENKEKLHEFGKAIFPNSLPVLSDVEHWTSVAWNKEDFKQVNIQFIIQGIADNKNTANLSVKLHNDSSKIADTLSWLHNFYNFIKTDFKETMPIFNLTVNDMPLKFIPDRELNFSHLANLRKDVGHKDKGIIDDSLLSIHKEITGENLKSKLLHHNFADILPVSEILSEEQVAHSIRDVVEKNLRKDDELSVQFKNAISHLYNWISIKINDEKDYFTESLKNKILSSIMPNEKIKFVTKILQLDRNGVMPLDKQVEILTTPHIERIIELGKVALENEQQEDGNFIFKKMIGVHIEKLVREKIKNDVAKFKTPLVGEKQGGQDIIVIIEGEIVYYIEVKSRWSKNSRIEMSNTQIKRATENKSIYSLCCVDMCDYNPSNLNRYQVEDISLIKDKITFLNKIGEQIEPLISNALKAEAIEDEIRLTNDYRAIIPPKKYKSGMELDLFVDYLIKTLGLV